VPFGLEIVNIEVVKIKRIIIDLNRIGLYNLPGIIIDCNWLGLSTTLEVVRLGSVRSPSSGGRRVLGARAYFPPPYTPCYGPYITSSTTTEERHERVG